jgi:uncharacterized protein YegP (UPF0339 family)
MPVQMADANVEIYEDDAGEWRWRLQADNGEIVAVGEGYSRKADAKRGWEAVVAATRVAYIKGLTATDKEEQGDEPTDDVD